MSKSARGRTEKRIKHARNRDITHKEMKQCREHAVNLKQDDMVRDSERIRQATQSDFHGMPTRNGVCVKKGAVSVNRRKADQPIRHMHSNHSPATAQLPAGCQHICTSNSCSCSEAKDSSKQQIAAVQWNTETENR